MVVKYYLNDRFRYKIQDPIFILAPPRSGSTMLFETIAKVEKLYCLNKEVDIVWWKHFPYHPVENPNDYIASQEISWRKIIDLRRDFYKKAVVAHADKHNRDCSLSERLGLKTIRYYDKTIANCFHLEALDKLFPDAKYIFLKRDPRANISSMIEGWKYLDRFGKRQLNPIIRKINNSEVDHWTYPAPPGWQKIVQKTLPEICAWSWKQHIQYVLRFFEDNQKPLYEVSYEEIVENPKHAITTILDWLNIDVNKEIKKSVSEFSLSKTTVSKPEPEKWKRKNYNEIQKILPDIKDTANEIGYDV